MKLYNALNGRGWETINITKKYPGVKIVSHADKLEIINQRGCTCGIYALAAILRAYGVSVKATSGMQYPDRNEAPSLRKIAKEKGFTRIGELFSAADILSLAGSVPGIQSLSFNVASAHDNAAFIRGIKDSIDLDRLVMVPFSVGNDGEPEFTGMYAHWCIIFGYKTYPAGNITFLVAHWGTVYEFDAAALARSNSAITDFHASYWYKRITAGNRPDNIDYDECKEAGCTENHNTVDINCAKKGNVSCCFIPNSSLSATLAKQFVIIG